MMLSGNQVRTLGLDGTNTKNISSYKNITSLIKTLNSRASKALIAGVASTGTEALSDN